MRSKCLLGLVGACFALGVLTPSRCLLAQGTLINISTNRDMVFDNAGKYLYISTSDGTVERYNLATGQLDSPYVLGGSLNGMDIAPDDSFILVAQDNAGVSEGVLEKVSLSGGKVTNIEYKLDFGEAGSWDVAIASNNLAFMTTTYNGSGFTRLRQLDLRTSTFSFRADAPGVGGGGYLPASVSDGARIYSGADKTRLCFLESNTSAGTIFTYEAKTDSFGPASDTDTFLETADAGVSRSGNLIGTIYGKNFLTLDTAPNFGFVHSFNGLDVGVAFDAVRDVVYGANSATDEIEGYSTKNFALKFRAKIGEDVQAPAPPGPGTTLVASHDGRYLALATPSGIRLVPTASTGTAKLANISTRLAVEQGDDVLIGGFIVSGPKPKQVVIRGLGPSLPLSGTLQDPLLELHGGNPDRVIARNDNWKSASNSSQIPKELQPTDPRESAILITLQPGAYTAIVRGANETSGIGLVEVYDLTPDADSQLANVSTRGLVQTGDDIMIGGFIAQGGDGISEVLVRALGPSLKKAGITDALLDPILELHDRNGTVIAENDNWRSTQEAAIKATGLAPSDDREAAILMTVTAGGYTAVVRGAGNSVGVGLVEAYNIQ